MPGGKKLPEHAVTAGSGIENEVGAVPSVCCMKALECCFSQLGRKQGNEKNNNNNKILFYLLTLTLFDFKFIDHEDNVKASLLSITPHTANIQLRFRDRHLNGSPLSAVSTRLDVVLN